MQLVRQDAGRGAALPPGHLLVAGAEATANKDKNEVLVVVTRNGSGSGKSLRRRVSERADWQHERNYRENVPKGPGQVHVSSKNVHQVKDVQPTAGQADMRGLPRGLQVSHGLRRA